MALDPFPFSGSTITCESLWMGVPVVTCPGDTFASRHSLCHLTNVGLTETIAHDLDEYVELAVSLASDQPRLAALRSGLRERMTASPLCDGKRFAANLISILYRSLGQRKSVAIVNSTNRREKSNWRERNRTGGGIGAAQFVRILNRARVALASLVWSADGSPWARGSRTPRASGVPTRSSAAMARSTRRTSGGPAGPSVTAVP